MPVPKVRETLDCRHHLVTAEADLREKNQVTIPKRVIEMLGGKAGDRLVFMVDECDPTVVHVHRVLHSYAGILAGAYGTPAEVAAYIRGEQEDWDE